MEDEADNEPDDGARHETEIAVNTALDSANRETMAEPVQVDGTPVPKRRKRKSVRAPTTPDVHVTAASLQHEDDATKDEPAPAVKSRRVEKIPRKWVKKDISAGKFGPQQIVQNRYAYVDSTPCAPFEQFLDDEIIDMLVENTNKYARVAKGKPSFQTTSGEFRLFLAILYTSGYVPLPRRRLYWDQSDDVRNNAISAAMPRNRFDKLMQRLHVADNENLPPGDRFAKVRPLFTALNKRFLTVFPGDLNLLIDESMVPYFGRLSAKQFIRGKPIRFGFKVWSINTQLGYCIPLDPYQGAGISVSELGLGGSVVLNLVQALPADKYSLYFDNFFTNLPLLERLTSDGIQATETVRVNRIEKCPVMPVDKMKKTDSRNY